MRNKAKFVVIGIGAGIAFAFNYVFGCRHKNLSFPISSKGRNRTAAQRFTGIYVTCLKCGKEFAYDWQEMKVIDAYRISGTRRGTRSRPGPVSIEPRPAETNNVDLGATGTNTHTSA